MRFRWADAREESRTKSEPRNGWRNQRRTPAVLLGRVGGTRAGRMGCCDACHKRANRSECVNVAHRGAGRLVGLGALEGFGAASGCWSHCKKTVFFSCHAGWAFFHKFWKECAAVARAMDTRFEPRPTPAFTVVARLRRTDGPKLWMKPRRSACLRSRPFSGSRARAIAESTLNSAAARALALLSRTAANAFTTARWN